MAWNFVSKATVKELHSVAERDLRDSWSNWVESLIRQHLGEPNLGATETITDEYLNGDGTHTLSVRRPKIRSVTSLKINDVPVLASEYVVFDTYVALKAAIFPQGVLNIKISYESGSDVDPTVEFTAAAMIAAIANYNGRNGADSSIKWGNLDSREGEETPTARLGLPKHLQSIMRQNLRRNRLKIR